MRELSADFPLRECNRVRSMRHPLLMAYRPPLHYDSIVPTVTHAIVRGAGEIGGWAGDEMPRL